MPLRRGGAWRKRWRYVAVFAAEAMLCAARVEVGPLGQSFWALWDRRLGRLAERTRARLPGSRGPVWFEAPGGAGEWPIGAGGEAGSHARISARHPDAGEVEARLRFGAGRWVEVVCPAEGSGYVWTRKRADLPVEVELEVGGERLTTSGRGVEDESAGYHPRRTAWSWSAGIGTAADGRSLGWNLVAGVNDPPRGSERAIWVDGDPAEPGPVGFEGLDAIRFDDGSRLEFAAESERRHAQSLLLVSSRYRQPFGSFTGTLPGGIDLASGLGVMEHHEARW